MTYNLGRHPPSSSGNLMSRGLLDATVLKQVELQSCGNKKHLITIEMNTHN
jgi:hypothetical protein